MRNLCSGSVSMFITTQIILSKSFCLIAEQYEFSEFLHPYTHTQHTPHVSARRYPFFGCRAFCRAHKTIRERTLFVYLYEWNIMLLYTIFRCKYKRVSTVTVLVAASLFSERNVLYSKRIFLFILKCDKIRSTVTFRCCCCCCGECELCVWWTNVDDDDDVKIFSSVKKKI